MENYSDSQLVVSGSQAATQTAGGGGGGRRRGWGFAGGGRGKAIVRSSAHTNCVSCSKCTKIVRQQQHTSVPLPHIHTHTATHTDWHTHTLEHTHTARDSQARKIHMTFAKALPRGSQTRHQLKTSTTWAEAYVPHCAKGGARGIWYRGEGRGGRSGNTEEGAAILVVHKFAGRSSKK